MTKEYVINEIRLVLPKLQKYFGVNRIGLFGSYANKKESTHSDLDILVDLNPPYAKNYFNLLSFLEHKFEKKIDLVRRGHHLGERFIELVEKEIIYA
jgi:predicted nucleotidyltransferase